MTGDQNQSPGNDIDRRLDDLSSKLEQRRSEKTAQDDQKGLNDRVGMAFGLKIASEFVSAILVGSAIGWALDYWAGTSPFGLIFFLLLGFAAGVINVMRVTGKMAEPGAKDR